MPQPDTPLAVAILTFPETTASVVYGLHDLFLSAGRDWDLIVKGAPGPQLLQPFTVSARAQPFEVSNGVPFTPQAALPAAAAARYICIPEVNLPPGTPLSGRFDEEIAWLRSRYAAGATIATACSGAMLLAEAGLLDNEEATTHWAWCSVMRERYPRIRVREKRALVVAGEGQRLVMAGGGTSWLDLALYLIARAVGVDVATQVARVNLIDWHSVGQQPFASLTCSRQTEDAVIARCQAWVAEHYHERNAVGAMAKLSGLPERSFKRRFRLATGMPPLEYVHTLRIEEAKQLLESGGEPIEAIANEVGYEDAAFFSRLFRRCVSLTPAQYRKRFGAMRRALDPGRPEARAARRTGGERG